MKKPQTRTAVSRDRYPPSLLLADQRALRAQDREAAARDRLAEATLRLRRATVRWRERPSPSPQAVVMLKGVADMLRPAPA
jgi:hypothetical protein